MCDSTNHLLPDLGLLGLLSQCQEGKAHGDETGQPGPSWVTCADEPLSKAAACGGHEHSNSEPAPKLSVRAVLGGCPKAPQREVLTPVGARVWVTPEAPCGRVLHGRPGSGVCAFS